MRIILYVHFKLRWQSLHLIWQFKFESRLNYWETLCEPVRNLSIISNVHNITCLVTGHHRTRFLDLRKDHFKFFCNLQCHISELNWCPMLSFIEVFTAFHTKTYQRTMNLQRSLAYTMPASVWYSPIPWHFKACCLLNDEINLHSMTRWKFNMQPLTQTHSLPLQWKILTMLVDAFFVLWMNWQRASSFFYLKKSRDLTVSC